MKSIVFAFMIVLIASCSGDNSETANDTAAVTMDSAVMANNLVANDRSAINDTVFQTALPPVFDGDIIMQICEEPQAKLMGELMGGKYNHVGIIFKRERDGLLTVVEVQDSVRLIPLTDFVNRGVGGHVCVLRLKDSNKTLTEKKVNALRDAGKSYRKRPFDPVLNWDDSHLYSSEFVWKAYNNAMMLRLCPTRTVADFKVTAEKKAELKKTYGMNVSDQDEAVSVEDIYKSPKLEIVFEK